MTPHVYSSKCPFESLADIKGKKITVMGLGLNGGGTASAIFLARYGAQVCITDMKTEEELLPSVEKIRSTPDIDQSLITFALGGHKIEDFENADCVIKNPGVKIENNVYLSAAKAIETDISLFLRFTKAPVIAVTGSKGKSSTVSAIHYGLCKAGFEAFLGGNITVSPLNFLEKTNEHTPVVLELSSWQLSDLRGRKALKPKIAIITKIVPDHQNWYGNMEDYVADKRLIYADQDEGCYSIFDDGEDEPGTGPKCGGTWGDLFASETKATVLRYGKTDLRKGFGAWQTKDDKGNFCGKVLLPRMEKPETILSTLSVPGDHMKANVLNAALVLYLMGIPSKKTEEICGKWQGIDHRLQYFHSWKNEKNVNYKFYNDSCATVPEAAAAATKAFNKPVILLTGGTDKGLELDILEETLKTSPVKDLYFLAGSATDKILPGLNNAGVKYHGPFDSLDKLFAELKETIKSQEESEEQIVVFSPGATSFGMFTNEFDRGNKFMTGIKNIF